MRYSRLNRGPVSPRSCHGNSDIPRVRAVPILEGGGKDAVFAIHGAGMCVRGVGRCLENLVVPALIEEGLSDMDQATGVRDERAEADG